MLSISWLRWLDPQIDFGRELYFAWRISQGDHLGRDLYHLYGPLSDYLNALLFRIFGTSLRTLVFANICVLAGIVILMHRLLGRAFGFFPASAATLTGIVVFGFGHYFTTGNYNYLTPYAHQATHGMLLLMTLLVWLTRRPVTIPGLEGWLEGIILGLLCLTKTEYVLTGGMVLTAYGYCHFQSGNRASAYHWLFRTAVSWGALMLMTWGAFRMVMTPREAMEAAWMALLAPWTHASTLSNVFQQKALGLTGWSENIWNLMLVFGGTLAALSAMILLIRASERFLPRRIRSAIPPVMLCAGAAISACVPWIKAALALPGLLLLMTAYLIREYRADTKDTHRTATSWMPRLLLILAASGMLSRMALNPRIYHYGFFQALLAGMAVMAFLLEMAPTLAGKSKRARSAVTMFLLGSIAAGTLQLARQSSLVYAAKQFAVGEGLDQFYVFDPMSEGTGAAMWETAVYIRAQFPEHSPLLVVPEGAMLNFWLRRKTPLHVIDPMPQILALEGNSALESLKRDPPLTTVLLSRDFQEYGVAHFGSDAGTGKELLDWILAANNEVGSLAGDPLSPGQLGVRVYRLKQK